MTTSTEHIILQMLSDLKDGQRALRDKLDESVGEQARLRERVAALEAQAGRYITFKMLLTAAGGSAGAAGVLTTLAHRLLGS